MNSSFRYVVGRLSASYPEGEARALTRLVLETRFGLRQVDVCAGRDRIFSLKEREDLENIVNRLLQKEPVQYVLGQADFCGRAFTVAPGVLVPRPETEELAEWVIRDEKERGHSSPRILDIGTGSGCIAVTLALDVPGARVSALDVSPRALAVARKNALRMGAAVDFLCRDILAPPREGGAAPWDVIVANPPYVCEREREGMEENVLRHEPPQALFVPDDDPLVFYRAIGKYAGDTLETGGRLYVEINRAYGQETSELLRNLGLRGIVVRKDSYGNDRMIRCER